MTDISTQLGQRVERDVRNLIGELQMQIIVLRAALEQTQQPTPGEPKPATQPDPISEQEPLPRSAMRTNGATPLRG
jgi:hypothetical protein